MDEYLTVKEIADELRVNQQTVRNWIDQGSLRATRVGRRVRVLRQDLSQFVNSGTVHEGVSTPGTREPSARVIGSGSAGVVDARSGLAWTAFGQAMAHATCSLPSGERTEIALAFEALANAAHGVAEAMMRLPT